jgi:uncharacterized damage-inducible protein DinB
MSHIKHITKHFKDVFFGGNWTASNLKDTLAEVTWQQAIHKIEDFNTIADLTFHINYYVEGTKEVFSGGKLIIRDKYSFDSPEISTQKEWEKLKTRVFESVIQFTDSINNLSEEKLWENFEDEKYGNYYRNLNGIIEHTHYHLGQIVILKKLIQKEL